MKNVIMALMILLLTPIVSYSKMPEPQIGENFQRIDSLIDCQNLRVDALKGGNGETNMTVCFYNAYYIKDSVKVEFVLVVSAGGQIEFLPAK